MTSHSFAHSSVHSSAPDPTERYSGVAIHLHWLMAAVLLLGFLVGVFMGDLKMSPTRVRVFNWHKWIGIVALMLAAIRLSWRATHRPPRLPAAMAEWQQKVSGATHGLLYALFFAVPLLGWAMSSAKGFPVVLFGKIPLPDFVPADKALGKILEDVHAYAAYTLAGLVGLHVVAALHHRIVLRDGILARMLPARAHLRGGRS